MAEAQPLVRIQGVTKVYRMGSLEIPALRGIDLEISQGEFVAVMGPSGSGKSTLMNILGCLDRPTAGRYELDGQDVSRLSRHALADIRNRKIGFVFQSFNLLPRTTALKNVMLPLLYNRQARLGPLERLERARETLLRVGLPEERFHHRPSELSGGQQQRVAIARALVNEPLLILADEPTGNLDTHSGREIMMVLCELHEQGVTIVIITHEPDIARYAERVIHLRDGLIEGVTDYKASSGGRPFTAEERVL